MDFHPWNDGFLLLLCFPLLHREEEDERKNGKGGEAARRNVERRVAAGDPHHVEQVGGLRGVGRLPVSDLGVAGVERVRPHEVGPGGDSALHGVHEGAAAAAVGLRGDLELARLVLLQVVVGLAPPAVDLAHRIVAQQHFDLLVARVSARRRALVQLPAHLELVDAGVQH